MDCLCVFCIIFFFSLVRFRLFAIARQFDRNWTAIYAIRCVKWIILHFRWVCRSQIAIADRKSHVKIESMGNESVRVILSYLPNALNSETISPRFSLKCWFTGFMPFIGLFVAKLRSNFSEKRIFNAVPKPCTCNFPHNRHLSHPTQSMIFDMLRNFSRNSVFSWAAPVLLNIRLSLKCDGNALQ